MTAAISSLAAPRITQQPSPAAELAGIGANLTNRIVATTTNPPLVYQWTFNDVDLPEATNATLVLTNLQLTDAGNYVCRVSDLIGSTNSRPWVVSVDPFFAKITADAPWSLSGYTGIAWGDFNHDGFVDLFVSPFNRSSLLFSNNTHGGFTRITSGNIVTDSGATFGACWGDYDNDGWLDLFVGVNNGGNDWLYHNNGDGSFTKITNGAIVSSGGNANNCAWSDYDNDGFIDLFVANSDQNDFLFHNNGNGSFARITTNAIALKAGNSQGGSWGDYDNDGLPDLFVSRVNEPNLLYHNQGGGAFVSVTNDPIVRDVVANQGTSWGDYDNDGYLDMFVANPSADSKNLLFHNNGDGTFSKITNGPVANDLAGSSAGAWGDYDNDGLLDLFVANRSGFDFLYHNEGGGTFTRINNSVLAKDPATSFAAAWCDFDNNGFLDLFVTRFQNYNNALYRNVGNSNAWLTVKCEGRTSNRAAIGAKVRLQATIRGRPVWQLREISGGGALGAQNDLRASFGLGEATNVNVVRVEWPGGVVEELRDVAPRQFLTVIEPEANITPARQEVQPGASVAFTANTTVSPPVNYQWRLNGMELPGETNTTLVIMNAQAQHAGSYTVTVLKPEIGLSFNSSAARLVGPVIVMRPPRSLNVRRGSNAVFTIDIDGASPITYQWRFNGANLFNATNATLLISNAQLSDAGSYDVIVANSYGPVMSTPVALGILINPVIMMQPLSQSVVVGGNVTLSVAVSGSPAPFTFEWRYGSTVFWTNITSEPMSFLTLANVQTNQAGNYRVVVKNAALPQPGIISVNAALTVLPDSDGDGLPDDWENAHSLSPTNAADAALDADGDGSSNQEEYLAGTDPQDAQSLLRIDAIDLSQADGISLRFTAMSNKTYTVQSCASITDASWTRLADVPAAPTNRTVLVNDPVKSENPRFYRVITARAP